MQSPTPGFVLGVGAITPLGPDWNTTWRALLAGGRRSQPYNAPSDRLNVQVAVAAVPDLDRTVDATTIATGPAARLLRGAAEEALGQSSTRESFRLFGGSNHGEYDAMLNLILADNFDSTGPGLCRALCRDSLPEFLATHFVECRETVWTSSACTSGMHALIAATIDPEALDRDRRLVVSGDALGAIGVAGFARAAATTNMDCLPFHVRRQGLLVAEGAAALLLDRSDPGAGVLGTILDLGCSCDAGHPTLPDEKGTYVESAIRSALDRSGSSLSDIGGVVAHGTGTVANDRAEALALSRVFGPSGVPVTSVKGAIGHLMGAAGLLNCLVALEASRLGLLPATVTDGSQIIADIDLVVHKPRAIAKGSIILALASGFGGNNVAVLVSARK